MTDYTTNSPYQAAWLVYINGLEIPVMGVTTNWGVWQMPTAVISMVPHPMLQRIGHEDRLQVVIFYLDEFWFSDNPQFCLLGEFEVVGWSYSNSGRSRAIQLKCVSQDQILEQLNFYYIASLDDVAGAATGAVAQSTDFKTTKLVYPACLFMEGLTTSIPLEESGTEGEATAGYIKRPIDFVTNIFRAILSPVNFYAPNALMTDIEGTVPPGGVSVPSKNFFARWFKMTGYHKRWGALPGLEDKKEAGCFPILKAIQQTETLKALESVMGGSVGSAGSAWELLQMVFGAMFMEVAMIPSPPIVVAEKTTGIVQTDLLKPNEGQYNCIMSRFVKPQCVFSLPPTCNVVFPSMIDNFSYDETYITQPTRLYLSEEFISSYLAKAEHGDLSASAIGTVAQQILGTGYPKQVRQRLLDTAGTPDTNDKSFLLFPEEFFKGPVASRRNGPPWMYLLWKQQSGSMEAAYTENFTKTGKVEDATEAVAGVSSDIEVNTIFDAYAEYEYYRSRYAERQGGLNLAWNPYVLPGFPVAAFDQLNAGLHVVAYANAITHTFNASGTMSTAVNLSFMRTMTEFMGIISDATSFSTDLDISPVEIIPQIRDTFQVLEAAQNVYEKLLYRGQKLNRPAVFNWRSMVTLESTYGMQENLNYDDLKKDAFKDVGFNGVTLKPNAGYLPLFDSYTAAMQYVSRPVCTLSQYVEAYHGRPLISLLSDGTVRGEYRSFYSVTKDKNRSEGAVFWGRIYKLLQGSGTDPGVTVSNIGPGPEYAPAAEKELKIVDQTTGMAQTRRDWDKVLEEYRKIIRSEEGRVAPQR